MVSLCVITIVFAATPVLSDATVPTGDGTWGPQDGTAAPAQAEWSGTGGVLRAYHIAQDEENATFTCAHGHLTAALADGTSRTGRCGGHDDTGRATLWAEAETGRWNGTFSTTGSTQLAGPTAAPVAPTTNTLGAVVTAAAAFLLVTTLLLGLLYLRERRFKDYLVRRLYEETSGRFPHDLPEGHAREVYARILVKGKN